MTEFVKQYLHSMDSKAAEKNPRLLGETGVDDETWRGFHFDYCTSETAVPWVRMDSMKETGSSISWL